MFFSFFLDERKQIFKPKKWESQTLKIEKVENLEGPKYEKTKERKTQKSKN